MAIPCARAFAGRVPSSALKHRWLTRASCVAEKCAPNKKADYLWRGARPGPPEEYRGGGPSAGARRRCVPCRRVAMAWHGLACARWSALRGCWVWRPRLAAGVRVRVPLARGWVLGLGWAVSRVLGWLCGRAGVCCCRAVSGRIRRRRPGRLTRPTTPLGYSASGGVVPGGGGGSASAIGSPHSAEGGIGSRQPLDGRAGRPRSAEGVAVPRVPGAGCGAWIPLPYPARSRDQ